MDSPTISSLNDQNPPSINSSTSQLVTQIRARGEQFAARAGRRPRVLVSSTGPTDSKQQAKQKASLLADLGFDVDIGAVPLTVLQTIQMALDNDVHAICLSDVSEAQRDLIPQLKTHLQKERQTEIRLVAFADARSEWAASLKVLGLDGVLDTGQGFGDSVKRMLAMLSTAAAPAAEPGSYIEGVLKADRRAIAKTITLIESGGTAHQAAARSVVDQLLPYAGNAIRVGITGVPGVGKSTFIEELGMTLLDQGHRVAVLAVDPSSIKSGGSILGDKTRMARLSCDARALVRPSPSRGVLGGVARRTRETMVVCEAAGFDVIIVESVGVGQSEIALASMVDFYLLLLLAGAGDELQGIKKGVVEMADAIAINKADGDNIERAEASREEYATALGLVKSSSALWSPPVLTCSAKTMQGLPEIWKIILEHRETLQAAGELVKKRRGQALDWMWELIDEGLMARFHQKPHVDKMLPVIIEEVKEGRRSPTAAAYRLLGLNCPERR